MRVATTSYCGGARSTRSPCMRSHTKLSVAALAATGLAVAACTSSPSAPISSKAKFGGTLNIVAASGQDHFDPVSAYGTWDYMIERAYTRQLVSYPSVSYTSLGAAGWKTDITPVADMATQLPTTSNGGISHHGLTYTFQIKPGARSEEHTSELQSLRHLV